MKYTLYEVKVYMFLQGDSGEYLFINHTHKDSIIFGYVNPPAGHMESGETMKETVKREAFEEMGIKNLKNIQLKGTVNVFGFKENPVLMLVVSAEVPKGEKPHTKDEGDPVWVDLDNSDNLKMFRDVKMLADAVQKVSNGGTFHVMSRFKDRKLVDFQIDFEGQEK